jgi:hypothetical protein
MQRAHVLNLVPKLSLQSAELELMPKECGSFRKAWGNVTLVGNRTSEKVTSRQFRCHWGTCHRHLHNKTVFHKAVDV